MNVQTRLIQNPHMRVSHNGMFQNNIIRLAPIFIPMNIQYSYLIYLSIYQV